MHQIHPLLVLCISMTAARSGVSNDCASRNTEYNRHNGRGRFYNTAQHLESCACRTCICMLQLEENKWLCAILRGVSFREIIFVGKVQLQEPKEQMYFKALRIIMYILTRKHSCWKSAKEYYCNHFSLC